jgi:hypothetical protein
MVIEGRGGRVETGRSFASGDVFGRNSVKEIALPVPAYDYNSQEDIGGIFVFSEFESRTFTVGDAVSRIVGTSTNTSFGRAIVMLPDEIVASDNENVYVFKTY